MIDLLLKNGTFISVDSQRHIFWNGAMAVNNGIIIEIGPSDDICAKYPDSKETVELSGKYVFPGFINTHTHLFQTLLKGLGDDMVLSDWLRTMTFPAAVHITEEDCYYAAMVGCFEALHSGTTTTLDYMYPHNREGLSDGVLRAFKDLKIRGVFGRGFMNCGKEFGVQKGIMQDHDVILKDIRRIFEEYHHTENDRIKIWVAPAAPWSNKKETMKAAWDLVNEYGDSGFTCHISETPFDREATQKQHGCSDVELLEELGIVGPNVLMVHCVYLTERDIRATKYHDMKISHNAISNMYLSSGVAPVPNMIGQGISVSIGVDGAASNNAQDILELMKSTALLHKVHTKDPTIITAEKILEMATIDGARCLGMENEIGSLENGKKADFVVFNPFLSAKSTPLHNPVSTLVYSSTMANIEMVAVDGNILIRDGMLTVVDDESLILRKGQECADNLAQRAGITNRKEGHIWHSTAF